MLKAGQLLYDNDPRYRGRKVEIVRVEGSYAICKCGPRQTQIRLASIFSDGEPRRSGYSTVAPNDAARCSTSDTQSVTRGLANDAVVKSLKTVTSNLESKAFGYADSTS